MPDCALVRLDNAVCRTDLVFEGTPTHIDTVYVQGGMQHSDGSTIDHVAVRFQQHRVLKGTSTTMVVELHTSIGHDARGFHFLPGTRYLVFARMENGMLTTDRCTPTRSIDTVTRGFTDSLTFALSGQRWSERSTTDPPCR